MNDVALATAATDCDSAWIQLRAETHGRRQAWSVARCFTTSSPLVRGRGVHLASLPLVRL